MSDELVKALNELADWIERNDNVHCISTVRRAALTIERLNEENRQMTILLGKDITNPKEHIMRWYNKARLMLYMYKMRKKKNERK
jgi:16S rRNA C1402 (ribose-2'-O) methylase RsmI